MAARHSSGTWMAALRLTKAESCGVDYDDELAPVKPPASFHASLANTNTLGCRAHYSGTAQPHLFLSTSLAFCCEPAVCDIYYASNHENMPITPSRGKKHYYSAPVIATSVWSVPPRRYHYSRWNPSFAALKSNMLHSRECDISRVYCAVLGLPASACHPF